MASGYNYVGVVQSNQGPEGGGLLVNLPSNTPVQLTSANNVVTKITAGSGISTSPSGGQGVVTVSNAGVLAVSAGTNVTITGTAQNPVINASGGVRTDSSNTAAGTGALPTFTFSNADTAYGVGALAAATAAVSGSTAVGYQALTAANSGIQNTAVGFGSLAGVTSGSASVAVGYQAGQTVTSGGSCVFVGDGADATGPTVSGSIAIGTGAKATASNQLSLASVGTPITLANISSAPTATQALPILLNGVQQYVPLGSGAVTSLVAGQNIAVSGGSTPTVSAVDLKTTTTDTAVGHAAGINFGTLQCSAFGAGALANAVAGAQYATAAGRNAQGNVTTAKGNTTIGEGSGVSMVSSSQNNTLIGKNTDVNADGPSYSIALGAEAVVTASNQLSIGSSTVGHGVDVESLPGTDGIATQKLNLLLNGSPQYIPLGVSCNVTRSTQSFTFTPQNGVGGNITLTMVFEAVIYSQNPQGYSNFATAGFTSVSSVGVGATQTTLWAASTVISLPLFRPVRNQSSSCLHFDGTTLAAAGGYVPVYFSIGPGGMTLGYENLGSGLIAPNVTIGFVFAPFTYLLT